MLKIKNVNCINKMFLEVKPILACFALTSFITIKRY